MEINRISLHAMSSGAMEVEEYLDFSPNELKKIGAHDVCA